MKVVFNTKSSIDEILRNSKNLRYFYRNTTDEAPIESILRSRDKGLSYTFDVYDNEELEFYRKEQGIPVPGGAGYNAIMEIKGYTIYFTTATSGYSYIIRPYNNCTKIEYTGARMGFLRQNILFNFGKIEITFINSLIGIFDTLNNYDIKAKELLPIKEEKKEIIFFVGDNIPIKKDIIQCILQSGKIVGYKNIDKYGNISEDFIQLEYVKESGVFITPKDEYIRFI